MGITMVYWTPGGMVDLGAGVALGINASGQVTFHFGRRAMPYWLFKRRADCNVRMQNQYERSSTLCSKRPGRRLKCLSVHSVRLAALKRKDNRRNNNQQASHNQGLPRTLASALHPAKATAASATLRRIIILCYGATLRTLDCHGRAFHPIW